MVFMNLKKIPTGSPKACNVLIEVPTGSVNKYEYDETLGVLKLDYVFHGGFHFPFNYGFVPNTLAEDRDPLDAVVLSSAPIQPGTLVTVTPIGLVKLKDRGEQDNKLIAVPVVDPLSDKFHDISDLSESEQKGIIEFFKEIGVQKHKTMDIESLEGKDSAEAEIKGCMVF